MGSEAKNTRSALNRNAFTRSGYRFTKWNTAVNGSGSSYANGAAYDFTKSTRVFAQCRRSSTQTDQHSTRRILGGRPALINARAAARTGRVAGSHPIYHGRSV
jgi:hypothetical protein